MTAEVSEPRWVLTLYVNGASPRSAEAIVAVRRICDEDLAGVVDLTVINAADHPALVKRDRILALPTLVRHTPERCGTWWAASVTWSASAPLST